MSLYTISFKIYKLESSKRGLFIAHYYPDESGSMLRPRRNLSSMRRRNFQKIIIFSIPSSFLSLTTCNPIQNTVFTIFIHFSIRPFREEKNFCEKVCFFLSISSFEETNDPILSTVEATREEGNSLLNSRIILHFSGVTKLRKLYGQPTNRLVLAPSSKT